MRRVFAHLRASLLPRVAKIKNYKPPVLFNLGPDRVSYMWVLLHGGCCYMEEQG